MGSSGGSSEYFLRQLSSSDGGGGGGGSALQQEWECGGGGSSRRGSRRWSRKKARARGHRRGAGFCQTEEAAAGRKRVMVVVDQSSGARHAMMWALTHVASKGDFLTLLHVLPPQSGSGGSGGGGGRGGGVDASALANSLGALCKACKPEIGATSTNGSTLRPCHCWDGLVSLLYAALRSFMRSSSEALVEECISRAECLTVAVRRQSKGVGGYLISTRWQKNFWLLA
ncbi:hypothetical protein BAE44_0011425 [Dichanthelium oligosanthes]|uniref:UspA domain-containing protein n=1 Tax=Dichanthelium oligosanthes TaxID=888268 RepID=A0A1E5VR29_9POAL|nr:hypothetical protein BAE44_0011425 [Dichanthelium oligosanthes]